MKRISVLVAIFLIVALVAITGCSSPKTNSAANGLGLANAKSLGDLEGKDIPAEGDHTPVAATTAPAGNTKGFTAPDFTIKTIDGDTVSLQQLTSEKPTLLYFWATWCPYCKNDLAVAEKVYPDYKDKVNFLAIDLDSRETVKQIADYRKRYGHDLLQFAVADVKVLKDYSITYTTTKIALAKSRLILWRGSGEVDEKTWRILLDGLANS